MKGLTAKEEEIMGFFWEKGPLFVKEMLAFYEDPKPHFNTLSTIVRGLEEKGFLAHYTFGNTYQYYPVVSEEDFRKGTLRNVISKYFNNSYLNAVSSLVKEEDISLDELKQLIEEVEQADKNTNLLNENLCYGSFLHLYIKSSVCLVLFYLFSGYYLARKPFIVSIVWLYWECCSFHYSFLVSK